jgi:hypothetical protein
MEKQLFGLFMARGLLSQKWGRLRRGPLDVFLAWQCPEQFAGEETSYLTLNPRVILRRGGCFS